MSKVPGWLLHEAREILPAFVFFSIAFSIVILTDALYVEGYTVSGFHFAAALVLALIVSKAMLVADKLPFLDAFREKPLAYNTVWKTAIYSTVATLIYFAEKVVRIGAMHAGLVAADPRLMHGIAWSRFWMVLIWLVVAFLVFVSYVELDRRLGSGKLRRIFWRTEGKRGG